MLVDYYSTKVRQCFSTDMINTICWSTTTLRRYYPPGMTVFQYGHDLYDMLVDYYSTKLLSARYDSVSVMTWFIRYEVECSTKLLSARYDSVSVMTWFIRYVGGLLLHEAIIRPVWHCFSNDMIYTICWWTTPRSYYPPGMTVFQ